MMYGLTDIHQHLLWGMDDGARSLEVMQAMLREAHRQGIARIAATVHACPGYAPFEMDKYRERLDEARQYCRDQALAVEVVPGAEVAWTYQTVSALRHGHVPTLAGTDMVLLELWRDISLHEAKTAVKSLMRAGYCPVLAHAERYRCFLWSPRRAMQFRAETGAMFQLNADTLLHPRNLLERRFARKLLQERSVDAVATDAHGCVERPINLAAAYEWLIQHTDADYARTLTSFLGELT